MPTHVGPDISGEENLVFGYNLSDQKNSYLGEPTTNQANTDYARTIQFHNQGSYNNAGTISDAPEKGTDWKKIVITDRGNNFRIAQFPYIIQTYGTTKVYSVEYDFGLTSGYFFYGDGSSGFGVLQDDGKRTTARFTPPSSSDWHEALFLGHNTPAYGINDTIYYRYYQVEEKSYPTRYTPTSRSSTQGLLDLTGNNTINLSNVSFDSNSQMTFDGTNDIVSISSNSVFNTNIFSVESVFKLSTYDNEHRTIASRNTSVYSHSNGWWMGTLRNGLGNGNNDFRMFFWGDSSYVTYNTSNGGNDGEYHHMVISSNGFTVFFYVDGQLIYSASKPSGNLYLSSENVLIGQSPVGDNWSGEIPLVKFYNRELSGVEVLNNYNNIKRKYGI